VLEPALQDRGVFVGCPVCGHTEHDGMTGSSKLRLAEEFGVDRDLTRAA
jgi:hypothetical protein